MCVQPPSGGCVLKQILKKVENYFGMAAAFGRLCVEILEAKQGEMLKAGSRLRAAVC